jgi:uncharacterized protein (TIGR02145 family)
MKKITFIIILTNLFNNCLAQNYYITFSANGESSTIDSIKVENVSQCTSKMLLGNEVLYLTNSTEMDELSIQSEIFLDCYPNPFSNKLYIIVSNYVSDWIVICLYDICGRKIIDKKEFLENGNHIFEVSSVSKGIYYVTAQNNYRVSSCKVISIHESAEIPHVKYLGRSDEILNESIQQKANNIVPMLFQQGDVIKFTAYSGIYKTVIVRKPISDENVTFTFVRCVDDNGNSYAVVKIGNQWWMAENLNAGTYMPVVSPQTMGIKFCMNINGINDPTCPMGGLYEWYNLMQGASGCNGSGPPPNDKCPTPVRGLCPQGWHIPSHYEWVTMLRSITNNPANFPYNMDPGVLGTIEGGMLKENCLYYWWYPNAGANNITGFTALPGGDTWQGIFEDYGQSAYFWTSTAYFNIRPGYMH